MNFFLSGFGLYVYYFKGKVGCKNEIKDQKKVLIGEKIEHSHNWF